VGRAVLIAVGVVGVGALGAGAYFLFRARDDEGDGVVDGEQPPTPSVPLDVTDPRDIVSLARMIASEEPRASVAVRTAVVWATMNTAARKRVSVWTLLTQYTGDYGHQGSKKSGRNWYASTANEARPSDLALAGACYRGEIPDNTQGATGFDSPRAQRAAVARSVTGYTKSPEEVAADRRASGLILVLLDGVPEEEFRLWRPRA